MNPSLLPIEDLLPYQLKKSPASTFVCVCVCVIHLLSCIWLKGQQSVDYPRLQIQFWLIASSHFLPPRNTVGSISHILREQQSCSTAPSLCMVQGEFGWCLSWKLSKTAQPGWSTSKTGGSKKKVLGRFCYGSISKAFVFCSNGTFLQAEDAPPLKKKKRKKERKVRPSLCMDEIPGRASFTVQLTRCICLTKPQPLLPAFCTGLRSLQWVAANGRWCDRARSPWRERFARAADQRTPPLP